MVEEQHMRLVLELKNGAPYASVKIIYVDSGQGLQIMLSLQDLEGLYAQIDKVMESMKKQQMN